MHIDSLGEVAERLNAPRWKRVGAEMRPSVRPSPPVLIKPTIRAWRNR
jgi:hypothetical protein